jgi:uncharacterized protein (DUF433 family)
MEPKASTPPTEILEIPRIVRTPGVCGGKPRIDGHRITVEHIAVSHEHLGRTPAEIAASHPTITIAQVHAALAYYHVHKDEIEADIQKGDELVQALKAQNPSLLAQRIEEQRAKNPLLGLFADEPELMDEVAESAMRDREAQPLRLPADG